MSEKNNIFENDLLMRAILEGGQEEVPAHIWDAVSESLDQASSDKRRKTVTLWWRRAGVSAAVAAAVASVLVLSRPEQPADLVPAATHGDMIAVIEQTEDIASEEPATARLVAYTPQEKTFTEPQSEMIPSLTDTDDTMKEFVEDAETEEAAVKENEVEPTKIEETAVRESKEKVSTEHFPVVWEDETPTRKTKTSLTVSGITGTSGSQNGHGPNLHKAPALILAPAETGIKEKNTPSRYGLPVSVGAGIKLEFTPKWSLGVGLNYTYLTRTFNGTYTHVSEAGVIDNLITSDIRNSQHYIGIPVNAYYNIVDSRHVNFYAYAGGAVEKCVYDKYRILSNSITHKEPVKGVQLSANIGFGAEFMLGEHLGLYLDPSLRYYFDCDQPKSIRTAQPLMLGFELGFRFRL